MSRISYRFLVPGCSAKPLVSAHDRIMGTHRLTEGVVPASYCLGMRLPADDPLLRLRAAPRRELDAKPVPEKAREASERRTFMRSEFCRVGCASPTHTPSAALTSAGGGLGRSRSERPWAATIVGVAKARAT